MNENLILPLLIVLILAIYDLIATHNERNK